jgi:hypothetical protein
VCARDDVRSSHDVRSRLDARSRDHVRSHHDVGAALAAIAAVRGFIAAEAAPTKSARDAGAKKNGPARGPFPNIESAIEDQATTNSDRIFFIAFASI